MLRQRYELGYSGQIDEQKGRGLFLLIFDLAWLDGNILKDERIFSPTAFLID